MMQKINDVRLLRLVKYFILNKGYKIVVTNTQNDEIYLESLGQNDHEVIYITSKSFLDKLHYISNFERVTKKLKKIKNKTFKLKLNATCIYLSDNSHLLNSSKEETKPDFLPKSINVFEVAIPGNEIAPSKLTNDFEDIGNVFLSPLRAENKKDQILSLMKEISSYANQRVKTQRNYFKKFQIVNANKALVYTIIAINILLFYVFPTLKLVQGNSFSLLKAYGAASYKTIFIDNQWWRPITAGFLNPIILSLLIDMWVFYLFGIMLNLAYGNRGYIFIILMTKFLTYLSYSLVVPNHLFFGTSIMIGISFGGMLAFAMKKRVEFLRMFKSQWKWNGLIVFFNFAWSTKHSAGILLFAIIFAFLCGFLVLSIKEENWFDSATSALVCLFVILFAIFGRDYLPNNPYKIQNISTQIKNTIFLTKII